MNRIKLKSGAKVTVVGDIHEHGKQFSDLLEHVRPSPTNILVSSGDIYDKGFGKKVAEDIVNTFIDLNKNESGYLVPGNHEFKHIRRGEHSLQLDWISTLDYVLNFTFANGTMLTVLHGGVTPLLTWEDLEQNHTDVLYVRQVDTNGKSVSLVKDKDKNGKKIYRFSRPGRLWHEVYDGRFGYIASGHEPQDDGIPKFFNYSCNLDTACYGTGVLTAQTFDENGRVELLQFTGPTVKRSK